MANWNQGTSCTGHRDSALQGKSPQLRFPAQTLGNCGRNLPELSDPGTRDPKGGHGEGPQQRNKVAGFRAAIQEQGAGPAGA